MIGAESKNFWRCLEWQSTQEVLYVPGSLLRQGLRMKLATNKESCEYYAAYMYSWKNSADSCMRSQCKTLGESDLGEAIQVSSYNTILDCWRRTMALAS